MAIFDEEQMINFFNNKNYSQESVCFIKENYKKFYGLENKDFDSRLYPVRDILRCDITFIYEQFYSIYETAKKMEFAINSQPEYFKLNKLFQEDLNVEIPINNISNFLLSSRFPNFLQPHIISFKDPNTNKTVGYCYNDNYYYKKPEYQKDELTEKRNEYLGNNFSSMLYFNAMNPLFDNDEKSNKFENKDEYKKLYELIEDNGTIDFLSSKTSIYNDEKGFYTFVNEILSENNFDDCVKERIYKWYMKIAPYILDTTKEYNNGNVACSIFFITLTIMSLKLLYRFIDNPNLPQNKLANEIMNNFKKSNVEFINKNFSDTIDCEVDITNCFDNLGPKGCLNILGNDVITILNSLAVNSEDYCRTNICRDSIKGKQTTSYSDSAIALTTLIEFFKKTERIKWFDWSIFEVNITKENKEILHMFAGSLLEAALLFKNSLCMGKVENLKLTHKNDGMYFKYFNFENITNANYQFDTTCTINSKTDFNINKDYENTQNNQSVFSTINIFVSLASSIFIQIDNIDNSDRVEIYTNTGLKRDLVFSRIWKEYIKFFFEYNDIFMFAKNNKENLKAFDSVEGEYRAVQFLAVLDYLLQMKTWYFDSYFFWRSYRNFIQISEGKAKANDSWNLLTKYNDYSFELCEEIKEFIIVPHVRGFVTIPVAGLYSYALVCAVLNKYISNSLANPDFIISCLSRIVMKDLYIFCDQEKYSLEEYCKLRGNERDLTFPLVSRSEIVQKLLNDIPCEYFERMLGSVYYKWYKYILNPIINQDKVLKNYIETNCNEITSTNVNENEFEITQMFNQVFGYEVILPLILTETKTILNYKLITSIYNAIQFMKLKPLMKENEKKYCYYKFEEINYEIDKPFVGWNLLIDEIHNTTHGYKKVNLIETFVKDRCYSSVDDIFRDCNGLPLYLFYKNGINILLDNIYTIENFSYVKEFVSTPSEMTINLTKTIVTNPFIMKSILDNSEYSNEFNYYNFKYKSLIMESVMDAVKLSVVNNENSKLSKLLDTSNLIEIFLNYPANFSNMDLYFKGIILANVLNWSPKEYRKYLSENFKDFNNFVHVRNTIFSNDNFNETDAVQLDKTNYSTQEETKAVDNIKVNVVQKMSGLIFEPKWVFGILENMNNISAVSEDARKFKRSLMCLKKFLASQNEYFLCDEMI